MSIFKIFTDAFKKASTPAAPDAKELARSEGLLGPTNQNAAGSFSPLRSAPATPGLAGESAVGAGIAPQVASATASDKQEAPDSSPPKEPGPIEGGDDDTPLPPKSADFDPDQIDFGSAAAKGEHIKEATVIAGLKIADSPERLASGGEGIVGGIKLDDSYKVEGVDLSIASSDPEEGGEFDPTKANLDDRPVITESFTDAPAEEPERRFLTQIEVEGEDSTGEGEGGRVIRPNPGGGEEEDSEGGTEQLIRLQRYPGGTTPVGELRDTGDAFNVKIEEVVRSVPQTPAGPGGVPVPYPNTGDASSERMASALPFKTEAEGKEFLEVKLQEGLTGAVRDPGGDGDLPGRDADGLVDALGRKAGKGQQDYLEVKMQEVLISSRETSVGDDQSKADLRGDLDMARRPDVKDAHDRFANTGPDTKQAAVADDDDTFESSSLLELKPAAAPKMLPGIAGESADKDHRLDDIEADGDDDDADETDL